MTSYSKLIDSFLEYAAPSERGNYFKEDTFYKRNFGEEGYLILSERNQLWFRKCHALLCLYVYRLNIFTKNVREYFNPIFHIKRGKFIIVDELGTFNGGESCIALPDFEETNKLLCDLEESIQKFRNKNENWC